MVHVPDRADVAVGLVTLKLFLGHRSTFGGVGVGCVDLERVVGIEPASSAWKAAALPLCYTRAPSRALELSLALEVNNRSGRGLLATRVVGEVGLEPTKAYASGFTVRPLCRSGHSPKRAVEKARP